MAIDITKFETVPVEEEWEKFNHFFDGQFPTIHFEDIESKFNLFNATKSEIEFNHWKNEFNWKILNISVNYMHVLHYYNQGIPDDKYENLKGEKLGVHYWFSYHVEGLLSRIIGAFDLLFQILNSRYQLNVNKGIKFNQEVVRKLRGRNDVLHKFMKNIRYDKRYTRASKLRNDFIHNNAPTNLSAGISEVNGIVTYSKGTYTTSTELKDIVYNVLLYLQECVNKFNDSL